MKKALVILFGTFFAVTIGFIFISKNYFVSNSTHTTVAYQPIDRDILWLQIQNWRKSRDLPIYETDSILCKIARDRIVEVKAHFSHDGFLEKANSIYKTTNKYKMLGENLSENYIHEYDILSGWLASPGHKKNLEYPFTHSCIATDGNRVVHIFGEKQ